MKNFFLFAGNFQLNSIQEEYIAVSLTCELIVFFFSRNNFTEKNEILLAINKDNIFPLFLKFSSYTKFNYIGYKYFSLLFNYTW